MSVISLRFLLVCSVPMHAVWLFRQLSFANLSQVLFIPLDAPTSIGTASLRVSIARKWERNEIIFFRVRHIYACSLKYVYRK